jgi:serine/threonine-protein kinase
MSARMTAAGMLLGTAAYMSPEQARGKPVDKRADIWAFGAVLWEMVCGRRLFEGETVTDLLAAVLRQDVAWEALPATTPAALRRLLRRCLERDPQRRLRDIGEARLVLESIAAGESEAGVPEGVSTGAPGRSLPRLAWIAAAAVLALATGAAGWIAGVARPLPPRSTTRLSFMLPSPLALESLDDRQIMGLTPDGRTVVFSAREGQITRLFVRRLGEPAAVPLPGTEGVDDLFLSPDGEWVAFVADGRLRKAPLRGGPVVTLCDAMQSRGGAWGPDGTIVFTPEVTGGLMRVSSAGGTPAPLTTVDSAAGERSHRWPEFLPDGRSVLFTVGMLEKPGDYDDSAIDIVDVKTGARRNVYQGASLARVAANGRLLVASRGVIQALPFDLAAGKVTGAPVPVLEGVAGEPSSGVVFFSVSRDGTLAYIPGGVAGRERDVVWVDRAGKTTAIPVPPRQYRDVRISPDGTRLALSEGPGGGRQSDISIHDLAHGTTLRLTSDGQAGTPVWSPDGRFILYDQYGSLAIVRRPADGSGAPEILSRHQERHALTPASVTPDGAMLLLTRGGLASKGDLLALKLDGGGEDALQTLLVTPAHEVEPAMSPDGHLLAYTLVEHSDPAIMVQSFPGPGGRWQVSVGRAAVSARWSASGRELFYLTQESLMAVPIASTSPFTYGRPEQVVDLRQIRTAPRWGASQYDVTPDGKRFVFLLDRMREATPQQINVVLNWLDEVDRVATAGR